MGGTGKNWLNISDPFCRLKHAAFRSVISVRAGRWTANNSTGPAPGRRVLENLGSVIGSMTGSVTGNVIGSMTLRVTDNVISSISGSVIV